MEADLRGEVIDAFGDVECALILKHAGEIVGEGFERRIQGMALTDILSHANHNTNRRCIRRSQSGRAVRVSNSLVGRGDRPSA